VEFQEKLTARASNSTEETPIKITCNLLSDAERAELVKAAAEAARVAKLPLTGDQEKQALEDLQSADLPRKRRALTLLGAKGPAQPNKEISEILLAILEQGDKTLHFQAARAVATWGTLESFPGIIKAVGSSDALVRHGAMEALGRLKTAEGAEVVAKRLADTADRYQASKALTAMGPVAEDAVIKQADSPDWQTRLEVCRLLKEIGGAKSVPVLTKLRGDTQALVQNTASSALTAVQARQK